VNRLPLLVLPLVVAAGAAGPGAAQSAPSHPAGLVEMAVQVLGSSGEPVTDLEGVRLVVHEDGAEVASPLLLPPARPWEVVVYIDAEISPADAVRRLAAALGARLDKLLALGAVELVVADPEPRPFLFATERRDFLDEALARIELGSLSGDVIRATRTTFLDARRERPGGVPELARAALRDEVEAIRAQHDRLLLWLAERGRSVTPRLLILLADGLSRDPLVFYLEQTAAAAELAGLVEDRPEPAELAEVLAAYGWTTVVDTLPASSGANPESRLDYRPTEDLPVGFRLGIGGSDERKAASERLAEEQELGLDETSRQGLQPLAQTTAGALLGSADELEPLLDDLAHRPRLRYRSIHGPGRRRLEVAAASEGTSVRAPSLVSAVTPEAIAEVRLRRSLGGDLDEGELVVASTLHFDPAAIGRLPVRLETQADLSQTTGEGDAPPVRLSVAVHLEGGETVFLHEVVTQETDVRNEHWRHETPIVLPAGADAAVTLVEDLASGSWGLAWAEFVDRRLPDDAEPARRFVQILPPERIDLRRGRVTLHVVAEPDVRRVEYHLNDSPLARRSRPPFTVKVDLDPSRPSNQVVAVAYDREDRELDRDRIILNESAESFWVRIVEPAPSPVAGPVDVEAAVKVPEGNRLERIELYYTDRRMHTWTAPPFRTHIRIPVSSSGAYLRAVAYLADGTMTEDVVLLSRPGFGEEIGVELVELYVVATDRNGQPVQGLGRGDFTILEEGEPQPIESFSAGGELPLSLGLAIDSSSSLFARLPDVQREAKSFVRGLIAERDRAFLVGFGMSPSLIRPLTGDLSQLVRGISSLRPFGTTPVWEAVALSLAELREIEGRRALVVFYDGDDEDPDFSYRKGLALARQARIPIYLIVMNNAAARTAGRSLSTRDFALRLERLAEAGGGRVFLVRTTDDLTPIFERISEELRSHYLITYYPQPGGGPRWRPVEVEVRGRGLEAHSISGYGPLGTGRSE
jgi:Ca-activated chloride channel family protein